MRRATSASWAWSPAPSRAADLTAPSYGQWGFDLSGRDTAVRPGDDFFGYANGTYLQKTEIPADRTWYGTINLLRDLSEARVHAILEDAAANTQAGPAAKVGAFYKSYMDEAAVEALDARPLASDLDAIRSANDRAQLAALMGRSGQPSLFDLQIFPDLKDSDRYAVYVDQGGLGLPDRDYYLEASFAAKKQAYQAYVAKMLGMIGWPDAETNAKAITDFETKVAEASWTRAATRSGWVTAKSRATCPPCELPTSAARSAPKVFSTASRSSVRRHSTSSVTERPNPRAS